MLQDLSNKTHSKPDSLFTRKDKKLTPSQALTRRTHRARKNRVPTIAEKRQAIRSQSRNYAPMKPLYSLAILELTQTRIDRYRHSLELASLAHKLSIAYNIKNELMATDIMKVFDGYNWQCADTGVKHTADTPLTFRFTFAIHLGGKLSVSNMRPCYVPNLLAGEWYIERPRLHKSPIFERQYLGLGA